MRAAVFHGSGDLRVEDVAAPGAPGPGQLRLRVRVCGICGTDLHELRHGPNLPTASPHPLTGAAMPQILGHELSAEVVEVGAGVVAARPGDRVAVMPLLSCGTCGACRSGRAQVCSRLGAVGYNWPWGGMGEEAIVVEHQVAVLPEAVSDLQGALVEPAAVALHAVTTAGVRPGDVVLVSGGGPIGQLVALAALAAGAGDVVVAEVSDARRERAASLGPVRVIDPSAVDVAEAMRAVAPEGADVAIECAGVADSLLSCIDAVRPGATVLQTALHPHPVAIDPRRLTLRDVAIRGCNCFPVDSWPRVIRLIASGRLPVERIVTGEVALDDVVDGGFGALMAPGSPHVKILVRVG